MTGFIALCLLARMAYALNDIWVGRLARRHSSLEVALWRGVTLGVTMAPLLLWVSRAAWVALAQRPIALIALFLTTALGNVLHLRATRLLPFGVRASFVVATSTIMGVLLGALVLHERLSPLDLLWGALLVGSAIVAALGHHANHEIQPDIRRGTLLAVGAGVSFGVAGLLLAHLARATHPFLVAWAWELGSGLVLLPLVLWFHRGGFEPGVWRRVARVAVASAPTLVGSGASVLALTRGPLGLWAALTGAQVLFIAGLGALWHRETLGRRRALCFVAAAIAVAALTLSGSD